MDITSLQNPRVKHIVKLRDDKKQRKQDGLMLVEGFDEITLAIAAGHKPQRLLSAPELATQPFAFDSAETLTVSRAVFEKMSYRDNPDGWLAIFPIPTTTFESMESGSLLPKLPLIIIAESIEKPGNLGAILRTADAAHVDAVLLCDPRVDLVVLALVPLAEVATAEVIRPRRIGERAADAALRGALGTG